LPEGFKVNQSYSDQNLVSVNPIAQAESKKYLIFPRVAIIMKPFSGNISGWVEKK